MREVLVAGERFTPWRLVYGLVDPDEPYRVRYVGKTAKGPLHRYYGHISGMAGSGKLRRAWILDLIAAERYPHMVLLEAVGDDDDLDARERHWILALQAIGEADTNAPAPKPDAQAQRDRRNFLRRRVPARLAEAHQL